MLEEGLEHGHIAVNTTVYCVIQQQQVADWKFIHEPMRTIFCESCKKIKKKKLSADCKKRIIDENNIFGLKER